MTTALLIMLREGFEAALVVAIVFAYLRRIGRQDLSVPVWIGVALAAAVSLGVGIVVQLTVGSLTGVGRLRAFAVISLLAMAVLTWMIFWMRRQSRLIKGDLEHRVDSAIASDNTKWALVGVAFIAVLREGIEAALFLLAAATDESGSAVLIGGLIGLAIASAVAYLVYFGGKKLPMATFFKVTGVILIVFAAGLGAKSVNLLQSANDLSSFNLNGVYDARSVSWLTDSSEIGKFLTAMFGWDPRPSIEQVVVWFGYFIPVTYFFLRKGKGKAPTPKVAAAVAPAASSEPAPETTPA